MAFLGLGSLVAVAEMGRGFRDWEHRTLSHCIVGGKRRGGKICFSHMPFFKMCVEHEFRAQIGARWPGFEFWLHYLLCDCGQVTWSLCASEFLTCNMWLITDLTF